MIVSSTLPLRQARDSFEGEYLRLVLAASNGNVSKAARVLDTPRSNFYKLLRKHAIDPRQFKRKHCRTCGHEWETQ